MMKTVLFLVLTCVLMISSLDTIYLRNVECLGFFFCDNEKISVAALDSQGSLSNIATVIASEKYDAVEGMTGSSTISADRSLYYLAMTNSTYGMLYTVNVNNNNFISKAIPPTYQGEDFSNIAHNAAGKNVIANYGSYLVSFTSQGAINPIKQMWTKKNLTSSNVVSLVNEVYTVIVYDASDNNACYYYYSVNLKTKVVSVSVCFPQYIDDQLTTSAYTPYFIYQTAKNSFLRVGSNALGGDISVVDSTSGNSTASILNFRDFAGLGWNLPEEVTGTTVYDPKTLNLYMAVTDTNMQQNFGTVNTKTYATNTVKLNTDNTLSLFQ